MAKPTHNYYDILHVSPNATQDEIRHAFNKMSHAFHPDHHATEGEENREEFEKQFRLVKEAYDCLRDPEKRRSYDQAYFQTDPEKGYEREEPSYDTGEKQADAQTGTRTLSWRPFLSMRPFRSISPAYIP